MKTTKEVQYYYTKLQIIFMHVAMNNASCKQCSML